MRSSQSPTRHLYTVRHDRRLELSGAIGVSHQEHAGRVLINARFSRGRALQITGAFSRYSVLSVESYSSAEDYHAALRQRGALPAGFRCTAVSTEFEPAERPGRILPINLGLILLDEPSPIFAATLTRNALRGAPIEVVADLIADRRRVRGIVINNAVANVGVATGRADAETLLERVGALTDSPPGSFAPASTGVIGWRLPVAPMVALLPSLVETASADGALKLARAIMTTDRYPKLRSRTVGAGRVVGIAKGAGMIEPAMGTMLAFLMTDLQVERDQLDSLVRAAVTRTFNRISVDGDQSTSDMVLALSSGRVSPVGPRLLANAIEDVCRELAHDIVRNGEGVEHVLRVNVRAPASASLMVGMGKAVVNSPLVKTAVNGDDPNVGRLVSAIGDYLGAQPTQLSLSGMTLSVGGVDLFRAGTFTLSAQKEGRLSAHLTECRIDSSDAFPTHDRVVDISVSFAGSATDTVTVLGADLSHQYVTENADYRS